MPTSSALPSCSPQLMPFHINFTGQAPITTFFRVRDAPSTLPEATTPPKLDTRFSLKKRLLATFRGRTIHGLEVPIPRGYNGIILQSEGLKDSSSSSSVAQKIPVDRKRGGLRSLRKARIVAETDENMRKENISLHSEGSGGGTPEELGPLPAKILTPSHVFSSLIVWNPDFSVDEGRDEFIQSLDEWISLSAEVRISLLFFSEV